MFQVRLGKTATWLSATSTTAAAASAKALTSPLGELVITEFKDYRIIRVVKFVNLAACTNCCSILCKQVDATVVCCKFTKTVTITDFRSSHVWNIIGVWWKFANVITFYITYHVILKTFHPAEDKIILVPALFRIWDKYSKMILLKINNAKKKYKDMA